MNQYVQGGIRKTFDECHNDKQLAADGKLARFRRKKIAPSDDRGTGAAGSVARLEKNGSSLMPRLKGALSSEL